MYMRQGMTVSLPDGSLGSRMLSEVLAELGDACMAVRRLLEADETRSAGSLEVRQAVERRQEAYVRLLEVYAAEPERVRNPRVGEEARRIGMEARRPARARSRSPLRVPAGFPLFPYLLESTADIRRRIEVLQGDLGFGCANCELEALQRLLWYREAERGAAGSGSSSSRYRRRQEL